MKLEMENKTFDEIAIGDSASLTQVMKEKDLETWAAVTGNINMIFPEQSSNGSVFEGGGTTGMWAATLLSTIVGTKLPGLGSVTKSVHVEFLNKLIVGGEIMATVTVTDKQADTGTVMLDCRCHNAAGDEVVRARAEVIAPKEKIRISPRDLPKVQLRREDRYLELIEMCRGLEAMETAVVHPCSEDSLVGAVQAAEHDLIVPLLVGPEAKIRATAEAAGVDIGPFTVVDADHSHHAAELSVDLVRTGKANNLMKGSLHTDELLTAVLRREAGLRTERRVSHCFCLSVSTYDRPIILTDAAINISPDLMTKRDICQNAIDLAHVLKLKNPKVAILAAVETVNPGMPATLDAAALCKMADRRQIVGGELDGPLAFDNAIDPDAARTKGIVSPVAGVADVLVVPDLEAGNMLAKQLTFMGDAEAAGILLGARVPIVLTSRADSARTRLASCALSVLMADAQRRGQAMIKAAE